jgi:hypothetical protein
VIPNIRLSYDSVTIPYYHPNQDFLPKFKQPNRYSGRVGNRPLDQTRDGNRQLAYGFGEKASHIAYLPFGRSNLGHEQTLSLLSYCRDILTFHLSTMFRIILRTAAYCSRIACSCANNCWICEGTSRISEDKDARWASLTGRLIYCGKLCDWKGEAAETVALSIRALYCIPK